MKKKPILRSAFLLLSILFGSRTYGQVQPLPRLELQAGEVYQVGPKNTLVVDTLILHDKATIRFAPGTTGMLGVKVAYVGNNCTITSKGADGAHGNREAAGADGENGGNLDIDIHFEALGSLVIDTRGGSGGKGYTGKPGSKPRTYTTSHQVTDSSGKTYTVHKTDQVSTGTNGEAGTPGGAGGDGGNLTLSYIIAPTTLC
ncbi:hypothetical protein [Pontibacter ruber]|uniref:Collagen-like protein n=1 Tax=Pontibacter ruber TaxID=1343895 RepID=A0ABW5CTY0_9BACT|nr:hypothetical protein [Pontibacter ruber]